MAYGVAALAVCVIGAGILLSGGSQVSDLADVDRPSFVQPVTFVQAEEQPLVVPVTLLADTRQAAEKMEADMVASISAESIPTSEKPLIILRVDSRHQSERGRLSFGGDASVPVSFE